MADYGWYNGWSPEERAAATPIQRAAIASGEMARPTICSICGCVGNRSNWRADDAVWLHDEDYSRPLASYSVCRRCHITLHRRFDDPAPWLQLVAKYGVCGAAWFELLNLDPRIQYRPFTETYPDVLPAAHCSNGSP